MTSREGPSSVPGRDSREPCSSSTVYAARVRREPRNNSTSWHCGTVRDREAATAAVESAQCSTRQHQFSLRSTSQARATQQQYGAALRDGTSQSRPLQQQRSLHSSAQVSTVVRDSRGRCSNREAAQLSTRLHSTSQYENRAKQSKSAPQDSPRQHSSVRVSTVIRDSREPSVRATQQ